MKKRYLKSYDEAMDIAVNRCIVERDRYWDNLHFADLVSHYCGWNKILCGDIPPNFRDIDNPVRTIEILRDRGAFNNAMFGVAYLWNNAPITKKQRELLGNRVISEIKTIYKTL